MKVKKINVNTLKRIIATGLIVITTSTFVGCANVSAKKETSNNNTPTTIQEVTTTQAEIAEVPNKNIETTTSNVKVATNNEDISTISETDKLLDSLDDEKVAIKDTTSYMLDNMNKIDATDGKITNEELYIASYAYQKLLNSNIDKEVFLNELNTLMIEQLLPRDMDENEWLANFGNISSTLNEQESLYDTYFVLAYLIHESSCAEKHTLNEYGSIDCKVLQKEFTNKYNN